MSAIGGKGTDSDVGSVLDRLRSWFVEVLDATGTTGRALLGGCLLVGLGLGTLLWLTRQTPPSVESTLPLLEPSSVTTTPTTTEAPGPVVVHVAGAVADPGVQELPAGARVVDAVTAAGGPTAAADTSQINLAAVVEDGTQIYLPAVGETPPVVDTPASSASGEDPGDGPVNVNTADLTMLETLPGVGPSTAAAIIEHREKNGPFTSPEGLLDVSGIGEGKLSQMRDLITT